MTTDPPELSLSAPEAATTVGPAEAEREVTIDPDAAKRIDALVATFVGSVRAIDVHGDDYRRRVDDIDSLADREIRSTSEMSNRLLDRPTRAMRGLGQGDAPIAKSLLDLRRSVEELNPAKHDLTQGGPRKLLGVVPFGDRVRAYFAKYQKSQSHIEGIVGALREGGAELEKDNAAIGQEQKALWSQMETLRQYTYMAEKLDTSLEAQVNHVAIGGIAFDAGDGRIQDPGVAAKKRPRFARFENGARHGKAQGGLQARSFGRRREIGNEVVHSRLLVIERVGQVARRAGAKGRHCARAPGEWPNRRNTHHPPAGALLQVV